MEIGDSIHISSIKLEEGVEPTITDRDFTIATIAPPTVMKVEEEKTPEEGEEGATQETTDDAETSVKEESEKTDTTEEKKEKESEKS